MRKNISTKVQGWVFVGYVLLLVLTLSLLLNFGHWHYAIAVFLFPFALEYVARCYKAKKVLIPTFPKKSQEIPSKSQLSPNLITSISILTFAQFVRCYAYDELNILDLWQTGDFSQGSHGQIKSCWENLYSQYLSAIKDPNVAHRFKIQGKLKEYETRTAAIETNCEILLKRYSPAAIKLLKHFYGNLQYLPETIERDVKYIRTAEIARKIAYKRDISEFEEMNKGNNKTLTPEEKEEDLINMLLEINKHEGVVYTHEMKMSMFAKAQNRLMKHIENLKSQTHAG